MPVDFTLTDEQQMVRDTARAFAESEIDPHVRAWDREERMDKAIVDRLAKIAADMAKDPVVQKRMADFGSVAAANTPQEFAKMLREETAQWADLLKQAGLAKGQ